jgi:hypothetical protein
MLQCGQIMFALLRHAKQAAALKMPTKVAGILIRLSARAV